MRQPCDVAEKGLHPTDHIQSCHVQKQIFRHCGLTILDNEVIFRILTIQETRHKVYKYDN